MDMLFIKLNVITKVAIILLADPLPLTMGWIQIVKIQLFQNMVMMHIKRRESQLQQHGSKYFTRRPNPTPYPTPLGVGVKWSKFNFFRKWSYCI